MKETDVSYSRSPFSIFSFFSTAAFVVSVAIFTFAAFFLFAQPSLAAPVSEDCSLGSEGSEVAVDGTAYSGTDEVTFTGPGWCEITGAMSVASVTVETGVVLTHGAADTDGLTITTTSDLELEGTAILQASEKGNPGGDGSTANGSGTGAGTGASWGGAPEGGGGAGYGGDGGDADKAAGSKYGSDTNPVDLGSGGGRSVYWWGGPQYGHGGDGGGLIDLNVGGDLNVGSSAKILANGGLGLNSTGNPASSGGGGSGGTINITTATFSGSGVIEADGGDAEDGGGGADRGGGGGGGRIYISHTGTSTYTGSLSTLGGTGKADAGDGSSAIYDSTNNDIIVYTFDFNSSSSPFTYNNFTMGGVGSNARIYGESSAVSITAANFANSGASTWSCEDATTTLTIVGTSTLDIDDSTWTGCDDLSVTRTPDTILTVTGMTMTSATGSITLDLSDQLTLTNSTVTTTTPMEGTTVIAATSVSLVNTDLVTNIPSLTTGAMSIDATSTIDADFLGGPGGIAGSADGSGSGPGIGSTGDGQGGGGGGHAGAGGNSSTKAGGSLYDSAADPSVFGSGGGLGQSYWGGTNYSDGGDGGGLVSITASTSFLLDGAISADAGDTLQVPNTASGGGGSGGAIKIRTGEFSGSGTLSADGGSAAAASAQGGGGSGGLVLVGYITDSSSFLSGLTSSNTAAEGTGYANGAEGVFTPLLLAVPSAPTLSAPVNNTYQNSQNPTITGDTYSDNGSGHTSTDWVVSADSGFSTTEWSTTASASETIVVNASNGTFAGAQTGETALASYTTYYARARYTNAVGDSSWSNTLTFTTLFTGTPTTQTWDFDTGANYTFDGSNIEVAESQGQLIDLGGSTYAISNGPDSTTKRRTIAVTNSIGSELTNYQLKLELTYDDDMQADFDDIRFTSSDGSTEIDYWIESKTDSTTADVWVEIPSLAASADTTIYLYYGNAGLSSESSIDNTFVFGDDFDDGSIDQTKWGGNQTNFTESSGNLNGGNTSYRMLSNDSFTGNYVLETRHYVTTDQSHIAAGFWGSTSNGYTLNLLTTNRPHARYDGTWFAGAFTYMNNWNRLTVTAIGTGSDMVMYNEGTDSTYTMTYDHNGLSSEYVAFGTRADDSDMGQVYDANWDWVFVREYASTEPTYLEINDTNSPEGTVVGYDGIKIIPASVGSHPYVETLYTFTAAISTGSADTVEYQIGLDSDQDGTIDSDPDAAADGWYYHDGTNWTLASNDVTDNDTATVVNTYLPAFTTDAGTGDIYFKAFLVSDGSQFVGLDAIQLEYNANPTTSTMFDITVLEDGAAADVVDLDDFFTDTDSLTYSVVDDLDAGLGTMSIGGDGTVDLSLAADANGSDTTITFRATDGTGAIVDSNTITVTVTAVNDEPSFTKGADQVVNEDAGAQTVSAWASSMSTGPSDESGQALTFNVANDNNSLFSVQPDIDEASGDLTFTPAANANGSATVTVSISDNGGTANSGDDQSADQAFTISVTALNDTPTLSANVPNQTINEDGDVITLTLSDFITDVDVGDSCTYSVVDDWDYGTVSIDAGIATLSPDDNANGSDTVAIRCTDGLNAIVDTNSFTISLTSINDAPSIAGVVDIEVAEGAQLVMIAQGVDVDSSSLSLAVADDDGSFAAKGYTVSELFADNGDSTGTFQWTPGYQDAGTYPLGFTVNDGITTASSSITVSVTPANDAPVSDGTVPNVAIIGGNVVSVFDLDDHFTDKDGDVLTYTATGNSKIDITFEDGEVFLEAPNSFSGSESIYFRGTDPEGEDDVSNTIVVTSSAGVTLDNINKITGKSKGKGIVKVYDKSNDKLTQFRSFGNGGVVPTIVQIKKQGFIFTVKYRHGTTLHVHNLAGGKAIKKKKLAPNLHPRKITSGKLDDNKKDEEIVVVTKRGSTLYFRVFSYKPNKNTLGMRKRAVYKGVKGNKYRVAIEEKKVNVYSKKGKLKFSWEPFAK